MENETRFNSEQKKAIAHGSGPMLVLAGPGSGKTTVITHRVKNLIEEYRVSGDSILVITYTRAAAEEMSSRFDRLMGCETGVMFGTFHSVFFMMLRRAYGYSGRDVIRESEKYDLIRSIIEEKGMSYDGQEDFAKNIIGEIGYVKGEMLSVNEYQSTNMKPDDFRILFKEYNEWLRKKNRIDFDDMLVFTYELLRARPDIRKIWQDKFKYILIDEFQDINRVQYLTVRMLLPEENNFFAVGDDDQSVYSFRGANPDIMLSLPNDFPGLQFVYLNINYRCSRDIVEVSQRIIKNNKKRYDKQIEPAYKDGQHERIKLIDVENTGKENQNIADEIRRLNGLGIAYSKIAVIYRTNAEASGLVVRLMQDNIPYRIKDTVPDILTHFTSINIMDYIRFAMGNRDRARVLRVINRPNRYISREAFTDPNVDFEQVKEHYKDNARIIQNIVTLENDLIRISAMKPFAAVNYIRKAIGYDDYIKEYAKYRGIDPQGYLDIIDEFQELSRDFNDFDEWFSNLEAYEQEMRENASIKNKNNRDAVTLATMHSAKGLEFDYVFIMNGVEGVTPHKKSVTDSEIEEERRMFYVAVTRARYGLYIYVPKTMYGKTGKVSRFINEMNMDTDLLKVGNKIIHKRYGEGTITYVDEKKLCVHFDDLNTEKTLSLEYTIKNKLIRPKPGASEGA